MYYFNYYQNWRRSTIYGRRKKITIINKNKNYFNNNNNNNFLVENKKFKIKSAKRLEHIYTCIYKSKSSNNNYTKKNNHKNLSMFYRA